MNSHCEICANKQFDRKNNGSIEGKKHPSAYFHEEFFFINKRACHRGKQGFQAYNSKDENIGIVYMCDDKDGPSYEHCELCMYSEYHERYGEWHIIKTHGGRIKWSKLCEILQKNGRYTVFID